MTGPERPRIPAPSKKASASDERSSEPAGKPQRRQGDLRRSPERGQARRRRSDPRSRDRRRRLVSRSHRSRRTMARTRTGKRHASRASSTISPPALRSRNSRRTASPPARTMSTCSSDGPCDPSPPARKDSGLLEKAIRRIAATGCRIQAAGDATCTRVRDRGRSAGARAHGIAARLGLRGHRAARRPRPQCGGSPGNSPGWRNEPLRTWIGCWANAPRALRRAKARAGPRRAPQKPHNSLLSEGSPR
jgi:hypothetical protein